MNNGRVQEVTYDEIGSARKRDEWTAQRASHERTNHHASRVHVVTWHDTNECAKADPSMRLIGFDERHSIERMHVDNSRLITAQAMARTTHDAICHCLCTVLPPSLIKHCALSSLVPINNALNSGIPRGNVSIHGFFFSSCHRHHKAQNLPTTQFCVKLTQSYLRRRPLTLFSYTATFIYGWS